VVLEGLGRLTIEDVSMPPETNALVLAAGSGYSTVSGLTISGASAAGIAVVSPHNTIEGNTIEGNNFGIDIYSSENVIGGTSSGTGNSIWDNRADGVTIDGAVSENLIQGNTLGATPADRSTSGNGAAGVAIFGAATQNTIGSSTEIAGANLIDGNGGIGVYISEAGTSSNTIAGNFIGTGAGGLSGVSDPNREGGVEFANGASENTVSGGVVFAAGNTFAIDAGGSANQVQQLSLGGGPGPLIIGGQSASVAAGAATPGAGSSIPVTVTHGPASAPVEVDLLEGSCDGSVARLSYLATTNVATDTTGMGTGTLMTVTDPMLPVFSTDDSGGVSDLADPCPQPTPSGTAISATEGEAFSGAVATIGGCTASAPYTATIDWGDGSPLSEATVTPEAGNTCTISGTHTYADVGKYTLTVHATATSGARSTGTSTVTVADAPLTVTGKAISDTAGTAFSGVVATMTDAGGLEPAAYTVSIDWGDGSPISLGTVDASGHIEATHIYDKAGTFSFTVTVDDSGGASATGGAKASITAAPSPTVTAGAAMVEETTISIPLTCVAEPGEGEEEAFGQLVGLCQLEIILEVLGASGGKSSTGATAARSHHTGPHSKVVVVGREKVTLKAGKHELVHVSLNTTGRRLLAQHHRLSVKLTITQSGRKKQLPSRTIVFKAGAAHKRH
jgi:parallel beta-helix repeat protein